jgi:hypothetical protein
MFVSAKTLRLPAQTTQLLLKADSVRQERSSTALQGSLPMPTGYDAPLTGIVCARPEYFRSLSQ